MTPEEENALIAWAHDLDNQLLKPMFIFRMAHALGSGATKPSQLKSARTRMLNAAKELERVINNKAWS